jgi:hypothetical protein
MVKFSHEVKVPFILSLTKLHPVWQNLLFYQAVIKILTTLNVRLKFSFMVLVTSLCVSFRICYCSVCTFRRKLAVHCQHLPISSRSTLLLLSQSKWTITHWSWSGVQLNDAGECRQRLLSVGNTGWQHNV